MATLAQQRKEQTRVKILDAAAVVFARRGHEAAECGIANGALSRRISETAAQLAPGLSLRESISCILDASWSSCRTDPTWSKLFAEFWALSSRSVWARDAAAAMFDHCPRAPHRPLAAPAQRGPAARGRRTPVPRRRGQGQRVRGSVSP